MPLFFERDADGLPQGWLERAKHALASIPTQFNTDRMVEEYAARAYRPLATRGAALAERRHAGARALAEDSERLRKGFQKLDPATQTASQSLRDGYMPGDLGFDPLSLAPEDPAEFRLMQEKELSHGRLAMIAAAGFLAQEAVTGSTWGTYWGAPEL